MKSDSRSSKISFMRVQKSDGVTELFGFRAQEYALPGGRGVAKRGMKRKEPFAKRLMNPGAGTASRKENRRLENRMMEKSGMRESALTN